MLRHATGPRGILPTQSIPRERLWDFCGELESTRGAKAISARLLEEPVSRWAALAITADRGIHAVIKLLRRATFSKLSQIHTAMPISTGESDEMSRIRVGVRLRGSSTHPRAGRNSRSQGYLVGIGQVDRVRLV